MSRKQSAAPAALLDKVRNMGIFAHVDAGKTTCTERILFYSGETHKIGDVDDGNTVTDFNSQEQERGITIFSAAVSSHWDGYAINLIDTPGHVDFTMEVERSMRVLDGGVLVLCAKGGVQPQTRTVWKQANRYKVPRLVFINKMDATGADWQKALNALATELPRDLGTKPVAIQLPIGNADRFAGVIDLLEGVAFTWDQGDPTGTNYSTGPVPQEYESAYKAARQSMVEAIVETDDDLLERFLNEEEASVDELKLALRKACTSLQLVPVLMGSAKASKGIQPLLNAIVSYLPSPVDVAAVVGETRDGDKVEHKTSNDEPLAALVFKVVSEVHGTLFYTRVYSGVIEPGTYVWNATRQAKERVSRIVKMQGNKRAELSRLTAGDIGVILGLKVSATGDTLCQREHELVLETINCPDPVISMAVEASSKDDNDRMITALTRLASEDPSFQLRRNEETGQTLIAGQGELHLEVAVERLKREDNVVVTTGRPQVSFRETVRGSAEGIGDFKRQSGGRGMYGYAVIKIEPLHRGAGFEFVDEVVGGVIPREFIPSVEKGVRQALANGPISGAPVVDVRVTLIDGKYHDVDSNDMAFQIAGSMAFRDAFAKAGPTLMEPVMSIEVEVPDGFMGNILSDLSQRRGKVSGSDMNTGTAIVKAHVPLAETVGYSPFIRNATKGEGTFTLEFSHYEQVSDALAAELVKKNK